jgi:DNA-binding Xre family transcriptional regulator
MPNQHFTNKLQDLMQQAGINNFKALSRAAGVSEHQILRLRQGKLEQMRVYILIKLSETLRLSLNELIASFSPIPTPHEPSLSTPVIPQATPRIQLEQEREVLMQDFQQTTLQLLESLLLQFPTAAQKARENPQLEAIKIIPLVEKPLDRLLQQWGIKAIAPVGVEIPYDPQLHQLMEGIAQTGEIVRVRYLGYLQGEKLLYRARVSLVYGVASGES